MRVNPPTAAAYDGAFLMAHERLLLSQPTQPPGAAEPSLHFRLQNHTNQDDDLNHHLHQGLPHHHHHHYHNPHGYNNNNNLTRNNPFMDTTSSLTSASSSSASLSSSPGLIADESFTAAAAALQQNSGGGALPYRPQEAYEGYWPLPSPAVAAPVPSQQQQQKQHLPTFPFVDGMNGVSSTLAAAAGPATTTPSTHAGYLASAGTATATTTTTTAAAPSTASFLAGSRCTETSEDDDDMIQMSAVVRFLESTCPAAAPSDLPALCWTAYQALQQQQQRQDSAQFARCTASASSSTPMVDALLALINKVTPTALVAATNPSAIGAAHRIDRFLPQIGFLEGTVRTAVKAALEVEMRRLVGEQNVDAALAILPQLMITVPPPSGADAVDSAFSLSLQQQQTQHGSNVVSQQQQQQQRQRHAMAVATPRLAVHGATAQSLGDLTGVEQSARGITTNNIMAKRPGGGGGGGRGMSAAPAASPNHQHQQQHHHSGSNSNHVPPNTTHNNNSNHHTHNCRLVLGGSRGTLPFEGIPHETDARGNGLARALPPSLEADLAVALLARSTLEDGDPRERGCASYTLLVNTPVCTTRQDLQRSLKRFGPLVPSVVCRQETRHPKREWTATAGYSFVMFATHELAELALRAIQAGIILVRGHVVSGSWAKHDSAKKGRLIQQQHQHYPPHQQQQHQHNRQQHNHQHEQQQHQQLHGSVSGAVEDGIAALNEFRRGSSFEQQFAEHVNLPLAHSHCAAAAPVGAVSEQAETLLEVGDSEAARRSGTPGTVLQPKDY